MKMHIACYHLSKRMKEKQNYKSLLDGKFLIIPWKDKQKANDVLLWEGWERSGREQCRKEGFLRSSFYVLLLESCASAIGLHAYFEKYVICVKICL